MMGPEGSPHAPIKKRPEYIVCRNRLTPAQARAIHLQHHGRTIPVVKNGSPALCGGICLFAPVDGHLGRETVEVMDRSMARDSSRTPSIGRRVPFGACHNPPETSAKPDLLRIFGNFRFSIVFLC